MLMELTLQTHGCQTEVGPMIPHVKIKGFTGHIKMATWHTQL